MRTCSCVICSVLAVRPAAAAGSIYVGSCERYCGTQWHDKYPDKNKEQCLPRHPELRPADLLVHNWLPGVDVALDPTVISPTLRSDPTRISEHSCSSRLDAAMEAKDRRYAALCEEAGWVYQAFPVDTFGALHAESRQFVGRLIKKAIKANPFADAARTASAIWRGVSAAAVGRAAKQLAQMAEYDSPLGLNLKVLDNLTPCPLHDAEWGGNTRRRRRRRGHGHGQLNLFFA